MYNNPVKLEEFSQVWYRLHPTPSATVNDRGHTHSIYQRIAGDRVVYVGATNDTARRDSEHP